MQRGIRGATTVEVNQKGDILTASRILLQEMIERNHVEPEDISHVIFTVTNDLDAAFPASAIRDFEGFRHVPVMCSQEIPVPNSLSRCIRVMMVTNTEKNQDEIHHIYHREATSLRPDLSLTNEMKKR
ncbi:chorismate mutase [Texcoconibacillus texcoconensis]|uniref:chorismate mutase n=1 Tax=Texcoconibacillus texcoconensis TaxID=1095777 RepID=A0A840QNF8_9BACI|nr:chorismate mutase [Texcoconibacillus texcoconensis]MBB5172887.1 chorismate mutase [Texcoconibacillus texcoconensis]